MAVSYTHLDVYKSQVGRLGGLVLAQGKVHAVLLGAGLERPDVRLRDFNVCLLYTSRCV